jgi:hypothetical protein
MTFQEKIDKLKEINDDIIHKKDKGKRTKNITKKKELMGKESQRNRNLWKKKVNIAYHVRIIYYKSIKC